MVRTIRQLKVLLCADLLSAGERGTLPRSTAQIGAMNHDRKNFRVATPTNGEFGRAADNAIALDRRESAAALAISERHLWALTKAGVIPSVKIGRSVRYRSETLASFAAAQEKK